MSTTDDTPAVEPDATPDPATWDPQAWLNGSTSTVRSVTVYGKGDIVAAMKELTDRIRAAEAVAVSEEERGLNDPSPERLYAEAEQLKAEFDASALTIRVEGRSEARLKAIDKRLKKDRDVRDDADGEQSLAYLADAIVSPAGLDAGWLRVFRDKHWSQYVMVMNEFTVASGRPPVVTAPFLRRGSGDQKRPRSS